jgi:acyl-CoA reductase-like NAD-dependent aldehyde dehydrogenase
VVDLQFWSSLVLLFVAQPQYSLGSSENSCSFETFWAGCSSAGLEMATDVKIASTRLASRNPATGETLREFDCATEREVNEAVLRARAAQPAWAAMDVRDRAAILRRFQQLLNDRKSQVARLITMEAGKPLVESLSTEILVALDAARFCADEGYDFMRDKRVPHGNLVLKAKRGRILREPRGVIGIISPWNYPFSIPATEVLPALITGNTVVLKPSEFTPLVALELQKLLHDAGVPEDVFAIVIGEGPTGAALVNSPIDKLIFTGSVATGKRVGQAAAERLLPVVLELGGKDAMLVLDDADVEVAAAAAVWGAFMNAGQTCLSVERCYVHQSLYDRFVASVVGRTKNLRVGKGLDPATDVGPMIFERQLQLVDSQVREAVSQGARVLIGGGRLTELGPNFYAPTVMVDVDHSMRIMCEETFGPVMPIMKFTDDEEGVSLVNDSQFALAASVWTRDRRRGERIARRLNAGTVMINDVLTCFAISEAPHGGFKASGIGRTHGDLGLDEMVRIKYVDSDMIPALPKPWWFAYSGFLPQLTGLVDFLFGGGPVARLRGGLRSAPALVRNWRIKREKPADK